MKLKKKNLKNLKKKKTEKRCHDTDENPRPLLMAYRRDDAQLFWIDR